MPDGMCGKGAFFNSNNDYKEQLHLSHLNAVIKAKNFLNKW